MFSFKNKKKSIDILAPISGELKAIEDVNDPVFSEKMMGDGMAVQYMQGTVSAPISGVITVVMEPSYHAFGMRSEEGLEIIVHVGLDTVNLEGEGFTLLKKQGDVVQAGEPILQIDSKLLLGKGIDLITPIVVTNMDQFSIEKKASPKVMVKQGETVLFTCIKS